ncbi:Valine--tRNA ligase, mitochondrial 1 [Orobanche gracilis]
MSVPLSSDLSSKNIVNHSEYEDARKKKKEEKARVKELKKQNALEKAQLAKLKAQGSNAPKRSTKKNANQEADEENPEDFVDPETPFGEKKRLSNQIPKQYSPAAVEKSWYAWWEKSGFFLPDADNSKPPFMIVLPPPNVTGVLHIGHALTIAIQDTIIRWRRMSGYRAVWVPSLDHAGIATQLVVEKKLMRERHLTRLDVGREEFVNEVWKWKHNYGGNILSQLRHMGASLDWSRECFTMDEKRSRAVTEAFCRLHEEGLIYRDVGIVNWDCVLGTAICNSEVEYTDLKGRTLLKVPGYDKPVEFGVLTSFAYPLDGVLGEIVVATTRVETMFGDSAIAVHPDDKRYNHLHGRFAIHPFNGRKLPIICDATLVDPAVGTGAVKITPAHDPNDFEVGKRHKLGFITIFTDDGRINSEGGSEFAGMPRFKAREAVVEALKKKNLYRGAQNNEMCLGICSRSNDVVEPMLKAQWYVNCNSMAKEALDASMDDKNRKIQFIPNLKHCSTEWKRLENIHPWCISRQIWWGHRVPAWYVTLEDDEVRELGAYNDHWIVARDEEQALAEAKQKYYGKKFEICQEPDVLDTWFSSGLMPLSVLGWPDDTDDFKTYYPTSVLETGYDIIFAWVARMVMLGMKLVGDVPFSKVYLHAMIRDAHGRKMSKSYGNVIDPLDVINGISLEGLHKRLEEGNLDRNELATAKAGHMKDFPNGIAECGTDALRFALVSYTAQSAKINLDIHRVVGYRQWCNKLWNAVRFATSKLPDDYCPPKTIDQGTMPFSCCWILSVLNKAISKTVLSLNKYELSDAATSVYSWWQYKFCDIFIEAIKPYFAGDNPKFSSERKSSQDVLWICLENGLRLLHPFMPFVTEELWQRLPGVHSYTKKESIMTCLYPSTVESWTNERVEYEMGLVDCIARSLRSLRAELSANRKNERLPAFALCQNDDVAEIIRSRELEISTLAILSSLKVLRSGVDAAPVGCAFENVNESLIVYLKVEGTLNAEAEREKMMKKMNELQKQQVKLNKILNSCDYHEKVPLQIREDNATKLAILCREIEFLANELVELGI